MNRQIDKLYFRPLKCGVYPMGFNGSPQGKGTAFAFDAGALFGMEEEIGVILYDADDTFIKIPFSKSFDGCVGSVLGLCITNLKPKKVTYNFYVGDKIITDENAYSFTGNKEFGILKHPGDIKSVFSSDLFNWENDKNPCIPYKDAILYGLNVRSFTMDKSSKVRHRGTYLGVTEKIGYLKDLGVTSLVLMPSYEFDECENIRKINNKPNSVEEAKKYAQSNMSLLNCWGFTKGAYYAPKSAYSFSDDSVKEFKSMVKKFHSENMEIIMQFYFPENTTENAIVDILRYWTVNYHIDGFRINGFNLPYNALIHDPVLCRTKLWFNYVPYECIEGIKENDYKVISSDNGNFRYDIRRFLKGDEGMINNFISYQKSFSPRIGIINYICDYDGFSLRDLYTYENKHNEENLENNRDGNDINFGWNCGVEGDTKKKYVQLLRNKQIKNAITLLMVCLGTPYIFSGDEFGNTREGNNNSYCIDKESAYVKWKETASSKDILEFTKSMIRLRKNNRVFHRNQMFKNVDTLGIGYPDLSYHGFEAWRPDTEYNSRMLGMYFCGEYSDENSKESAKKSFYIGINMHWENHRLAVPKLKNKKQYKKIIDTGNTNNSSKDNEIPVSSRSIVIYEA